MCRAGSELQGVFRGPQELTVERGGGDRAKGHVVAPEAEGGGIGGLTFVREDGRWVIKAW